jgi:DNA polymerase theta
VKKRLSGEMAAAANRDGRWRNQMHKAAHNGCCRRSAQLRALASVLGKLMLSEKLSNVFLKIESPLVQSNCLSVHLYS